MKPLDSRVLPHLTPARLPLTGVVLAGVVNGALVVGQAFAVAALVARLVADPAGSGWHAAAYALATITVLRALVTAGGDLAADRAAGVVTTGLRAQVMRASLDLGVIALSGRRAGELGLLATRGVAAVEPYLTRYLPALVLAAVLPALTVLAILVQDLWAGVIVLLTVPLVPVFAALIGLATQDRAGRQYRTLALLAGHFLDVVRGLPTLVAFNRAEAQSGRIRAVTDRYRRATMDTLRLAFVSSGALELIATLSVALVAVSVGLRLASDSLDLRTALVVLLLAPEAYWPLRRVGAEFHSAAEGVATFEEITALLDEVGHSSAAPPAATPDDRVDPVPIHIEGLEATYPGRTTPALRLDEATIAAPGLTAIAGPSGCGKSTLVQALLGELPPGEVLSGSITLAGEPIDVVRWRELVAQVPQRPWLTAGTIGDNLRVALPGAEDVRLWQALSAVRLGEHVGSLPAGLDTPLGEDGTGLSAGQRARLALARVVLANRPYVVLDEPTAHLDAETEQVLLAILRRLAEHATVVVVAHRPAVLAAADQIIELTPPVPITGDAGQPARHATRPAARTAVPSADAPPEPVRRARSRLALATALGTLSSLSGIALTATAGWLIVRAAEHPPILYLMVAIVGVRTFGLARPVLRYAERLASHDVALRLLAVNRARVYDLLVPLAPARLGRRRGDLLTSVVDDVDTQLDEQLRVRQPIQVWMVAAVACVAVALALDPTAAVVIGLVVVAGGLAPAALARAGAARAERGFVAARAGVATEVVAGLDSARQLVLWGADDAAIERLRDRGRALVASARGSARALAAGRAAVVLACGLGVVTVAPAVAAALTGGSLSGPMAALLLLVPLALAEVLLALPEAAALSVRTRAARERLAMLERTPPAVTEPDRPAPLAEAPVGLCLEDVAVGWDRPVLEGLSLRLEAGGSLGVVGPSGCGKSTIVALLVRYLAPAAGHYLLGGTDAALLGSAEVRRHVGLVDDDPYVFGSSLRENLRLARPGATDAALLDALAGAGLAGWHDALPHGLDTLLGDGAASVSGGERARLGIARALLLDPEVLVLDEPTAHLDSDTAREVSATLLRARSAGEGPDERRGVVWVTHDGVALERLDAVLDLGSPLRTVR